MSDNEDVCVFPAKVAECAGAGVKVSKFDFQRLFRSSSPNSDDDERKPSTGFRVRVPVNEEEFEAPTFDRIRTSGVSGFLRPLPQLPDLATLTGLGRLPGIRLRSQSDEDTMPVPNIKFSWEDEESSSNKEQEIENARYVESEGIKLQKTCEKVFADGTPLGMSDSIDLRVNLNNFIKLAISDHSETQYHYIWAVILDVKSILQCIGDEDNVEVVTKMLKMLRSKYIREDIPSAGAGGWDTYEYH